MRGPDTSDGSSALPPSFSRQIPQRLHQLPQKFSQLQETFPQKLTQLQETFPQKLPQIKETVARRSTAWKLHLSRLGERVQQTLNGNAAPTKLQREWSTHNRCNLQQTVASTRFLDGNHPRQSVTRYTK